MTALRRVGQQATTHWFDGPTTRGCWSAHAECAEVRVDALTAEVERLRAAGNDLASALETAIMARQRLEHWSLEAAVPAEQFLSAWRAALDRRRWSDE